MRAIDVLREFNICLSTLHEFLLSKGFDIKKSPSQKINQSQYNLVAEKFSTDKNTKIRSSKIEFKKLDYELLENGSDEVNKLNGEVLQTNYNLICEKRNKINAEIILLQNKEQKYWALDDDEIEALVKIKSEELKELITKNEDVIHHFEKQNSISHDDLNETDSIVAMDEEDFLDDDLTQKYEDVSDFNEWGNYHGRDENPWIDVFGPGDEAETAYWNTD